MAVTLGSRSLYSVSLDGTSTGYISVSGMNVPSGDMTLAIWINTSASSPTDKGIFGRWDGAGFMLYTTGGDLYFFAGSASESFHWTGGWASISDGSWHHLCATKSGTSGAIYLDGVSVATGSLGASIGTPADVGEIGTYNGRSGSTLACIVDDAILWDSALNSTDAANLASGTLNPGLLGSGPLGWWKMEDGTGTTASDAGSGSHNGVLQAGASWSSSTPAQLQDVTTSGYQSTTTSVSFDYRAGSGSDNYLFISVSILGSTATVSSLTVDGVAATSIATTSNVSMRIALYGIVNPGIPGGSTKQVAVTISSSSDVVVNTSLWHGVDQTTPTEDSGTATGNNGVSFSAGVTITTSTDNDIIGSAIACTDTAISSSDVELENISGSGGTGGMQYSGPLSPAGSVNPAWGSVLGRYACAAVGIRPSGGATTDYVFWWVRTEVPEEYFEELVCTY